MVVVLCYLFFISLSLFHRVKRNFFFLLFESGEDTTCNVDRSIKKRSVKLLWIFFARHIIFVLLCTCTKLRLFSLLKKNRIDFHVVYAKRWSYSVDTHGLGFNEIFN